MKKVELKIDGKNHHRGDKKGRSKKGEIRTTRRNHKKGKNYSLLW